MAYVARRQAGSSFAHPALFYRSEREYTDGVGGFVRGALAVGHPVLVAVPGDRLETLRQAVGDALTEAVCADMTEFGRNPGRILAQLRDFADQHHRRGRSVRIVGEPIWPGRSPAEIVEATRHEALINLAFAGRDATILCPYDTAALPGTVVADARRTHPVLIEEGLITGSTDFADPRQVAAACDTPLPEPSTSRTLEYVGGQLAQVREAAQTWSASTRLAPARAGDLVLAIGEASANSIAHGGGRGTLRMWTQGGTAIAEIRDGGRLADPLAGRTRPDLDSAEGGRGLWIMHQLCDLVEIRSADRGLTLRLHMAMDTPAGADRATYGT